MKKVSGKLTVFFAELFWRECLNVYQTESYLHARLHLV